MIPPVAPSVLLSNPQFALLHKHLTTQVLNQDASTRSTSLQQEPITKQLRQHHIQAAKHDILNRSLHNVVTDTALPPDLVELVLNIATYLSEAPHMNLSLEAHDLMAPEVGSFQSNFHVIVPLLSQRIQHVRDSLLSLAHASNPTNTPFKPTTPPPSLTTALSPRLIALRAHHTTTLPRARTTLTTTLSTLLHTHTAHLTTLIRHLELHTHGTLSRHTSARASYLSAVAAGLDAKAQLLALQAQHALYTPAVQLALVNYSDHLQDFKRRTGRREEELRHELELYEEEVGGEALRECARRYGGVVREIEAVKGEIVRLEGEYRGRGGRRGKG